MDPGLRKWAQPDKTQGINSGFLLGPVRHGSKATCSHARLFRKTTDSDKET